MTHKEAIEWLVSIKKSISGGDEEFDNRRKKSIDMAIKALEDSRWIPVTERLPEECEDVLVFFERNAWGNGDEPYRKKDVDKGWQVGGRFHVDGCSRVVGIAWMPLPTPYEGSEEDAIENHCNTCTM